MKSYVKVRIDDRKSLYQFDSRSDAFDWVKSSQQEGCMVSVLSYEGDSLEDLTRYYFGGQYFKRENITS